MKTIEIMEIKTTSQIIKAVERRTEVITLSDIEENKLAFFDVKWVRVDELIITLKLIRDAMKTNKEIKDNIDTLIKELK